MKCSYCGDELVEDALYCVNCGNKIKIKKISQKVLRIIIIASVSAFILLAGTTAFLIDYNNPVSQYLRYIENGKEEKAAILYDKTIKNNDSLTLKLKTKLTDVILSIKNQYYDDKIDYDGATVNLNKYKSINLISSTYYTAMNDIDKLHNSHIAYDEAVEYENNNDIMNAYKNIPKLLGKIIIIFPLKIKSKI